MGTTSSRCFCAWSGRFPNGDTLTPTNSFCLNNGVRGRRTVRTWIVHKRSLLRAPRGTGYVVAITCNARASSGFCTLFLPLAVADPFFYSFLLAPVLRYYGLLLETVLAEIFAFDGLSWLLLRRCSDFRLGSIDGRDGLWLWEKIPGR